MPDQPLTRTTVAVLEAAAVRWPDAEAVVDGDLRVTYRDLHAAVRRSAAAAVAAGLEPGDRAAIWAPNLHDWIVAALGIHGAGGIVVPVNTRFKGDEAGYVLRKTGARLLFSVRGFLGADLPALLDGIDLPDLRRTVLLADPSFAEYLDGGDDVAPDVVEARFAGVRPEHVSDLIFTSGTTGRPKGVVSLHEQTVRTFEEFCTILDLREGDRYAVVNPFFHTFGYKAGFLSCFLRGATVLPVAVFDPTSVLELISRERVTTIPGPPTLLQGLLDHPDRDAHDLSSLRNCAVGASVIPVELVRRLRAELFDTVVTGFGMTETTGCATMTRPDDPPDVIAGTAGRPLAGVEVRIVDDEGNPLGVDEPGNILVRGYNVMVGYFDDPEQTAEALDAEGWLHTGDIGRLDPAGNLVVTDRKKDMFIVGGFNAYPAEIEAALRRHPSVGQVAVVGVPDDRLGEVGMAFVVPAPGADVDPEALVAWSREEMANFKVPRRVEVVADLPLNASGKVLKHELRARALAR